MLKVLSSILCDLDPKVKVIGQKAGICDDVNDFCSSFSCFCHLLNCFQLIIYGTLPMSNSLDSDRARLSVGPDLGPNCLQRSSADIKICH